jgi:hypothetical protein
VVRGVAQGVGLVEADVVQEGRGPQDLRVVREALRLRQFLSQGVNPPAVGVAPDRIRPYPGDERLDLLQ